MSMKSKLLLAAALLLTCGSAIAQPSSFSQPRLLIKATDTGLMAPVWSPDGQMIAVTGDNFVGIYVANADGSELKKVSDATGAGFRMSWSGSRQLISTPYSMLHNRRMTRVERIDARTGKVQSVEPEVRDHKPSRVLSRSSNTLNIMLDQPDKATTLIAGLNEYAGRMVLNPALSPDGSRIAFQIVGKGLFVCNTDGTGLKSLGRGSHPTWMPDGQNLMITRIEDNGDVFTRSDIFCLNIASGEATCITPSTDAIPITIAVSPDGSKLAFDNDVDGCIYVIDLK